MHLQYLQAALACAVTTLLTLPLLGVIDAANIVMIFLLMVALVAARLGSGPAVLAAFGGVAAFDFFFVPPRFSMAVADAQYLITFGVMLAVALVIGQLAARLRQRAAQAVGREAATRALYEMAKSLAGAIAVEQVADIVAGFLRVQLALDAVLYVPDASGQLRAIPADAAQAGDIGHIRAVFAGGEAMHLAAAESGYAPALALPLCSPMQTRGVLLVSSPDVGLVEESSRRPLLDAVASLAAIAVERLHYGDVAQAVTVRMESERLRGALLSAVSHDLRTPLTVLVGLADGLVQGRAALPEASRASAEAIRDQALRLSGQVNNLLDMARLQVGKVVLHKEWQPLEEVVGSSLRALGVALAGRDIRLALPLDLPPLEFDAVMLERVLCNLLENAAKYALLGSIRLAARREAGSVAVTIADEGPGLPPGQEATVFGMFERGRQETATGGAGLGLAISQAIIEAHGGTIRAENLPSGGLAVTFRLPAGEPPRIDESDHG